MWYDDCCIDTVVTSKSDCCDFYVLGSISEYTKNGRKDMYWRIIIMNRAPLTADSKAE